MGGEYTLPSRETISKESPRERILFLREFLLYRIEDTTIFILELEKRKKKKKGKKERGK